MKTKISDVIAWACLAVLLSAVTIGNGCRLGTNVPHDPPIYDTNVARAFYPGLLVTFPNAPSAEAVSLMEFAGAKRSGTNAFVIERYSRHDELQSAATEQAYREGARVTGWRASP